MKRAIRKYSRDFMAIIVLAVIAAAVAGYILPHERLRFPLIQSSPLKYKAEFSTAQAVTPGQGQTVRVSGVQIGDIGGVALHNGVATVTMDIEDKYHGVIRQDATALLRPKTGLKDMFVELNPGKGPVAQPGFTIPVSNTLPDVNPDEIFASLDNDTRNYLKLLVQGAGEGLKHRGSDLQQVFARFEPTHQDLARINGLLERRHANLSRLIHSLNLLNVALEQRGPELTQLISYSNQVFHAFGSEQANLARAVHDLPGALQQTTTTLGKVQTFAEVLGPTADKIRPAIRASTAANKALIPLARQTTPLLANDIRPFVRNARPIVRKLTLPAQKLTASSPDLTTTFSVINHLFNMGAYNTHGNGPYTGAGDEPYLFWLAWLSHQGVSLFSTADAHGTYRPVTLRATCETLRATVSGQPQIEFLQGLTAVLTNPSLCGSVIP